jgi:hypothetical protein
VTPIEVRFEDVVTPFLGRDTAVTPLASQWAKWFKPAWAPPAYSELWRERLRQRLLSAMNSMSVPKPNQTALAYAAGFLSMLPHETPEPDLVFEDDGEVGFDWQSSTRSTFSVSIGEDGTLRYGGLYGYRTRYGTEQLTSAIPSVILECISAASAGTADRTADTLGPHRPIHRFEAQDRSNGE